MPNAEEERLKALRSYAVLDTASEETFDRLTRLAAELFAAPIALISLIDTDRQWFKSRYGLEALETPRCWSFCDHAIRSLEAAPLVVRDATRDPRFAENPLVTGELGIRFYAGAPLIAPGGQRLGALCIIDTSPRSKPTQVKLSQLETLAGLVVDEFELRRTRLLAEEQSRLLGLAEEMSGVGRWRMELPDNRVSWSNGVYKIHGVDPSTFDPNLDSAIGFYHPDDQATVSAFVARAVSDQADFAFQLRLYRADGGLRHVVCKANCDVSPTGQTRGVFGVFQDVTAHVEALADANQSRKDAEEKARRAAVAEETAGLGHWRVELPSRALTWSDQMYAIYGVERGSPVDVASVMAMTHPDDLVITQDRLDRDFAGEHVDDRPVIRIIRADGAVRWVVGHTKVETGDNGEVTAFLGTLQDITRQTEADHEIAESEALYRLLTENSHDLVVKISPAGELIYVSPSVSVLLGYAPEEMVGQPADVLVHPEDIPKARASFLAAAAGAAIPRSDYRLMHKEGRPVWVDARPHVLRDEFSGKIIGVTDVIRDVTARKAAEAALAESEARFRLMADNATDIVTRADLDGRFCYVSPAVETMTGYTADEVVGKLAVDFVHPDDRERVTREIETSILTPNSPQIEHRHIRKDGRVIWVESRPTLARDLESGKPFAVTDVLRDITARKEAEAALAATETRYRHLAESASDVIARYDRDANFLYLSPAIEGILGYAADELIGRKTFDIIHPEDHATVARSFAHYLKAGPSSPSPRIEYRAARKDGSILWLEAHPRALFDEDGHAYEFMDVVRDITARKAMEQELETARRTAEAATVVKSEFLSNMSHELRTPLTSILGFGSILDAETSLSEQGRRAVDRVLGSSQALLTIVNDILDFSKLESGQVEIDRRPVDAGQVLCDALDLLAPQADGRGLKLAFQVDGVLPACVSMDDGRVRQIILNLVGNGVKFTQVGGVTLLARYNGQNERLRCEITDSGPGIPADRLDRLFKRFSQVDASTTRAFGGTGLGLAICKGLVEAMGGEIGVTSQVGQGACFWFELPCPMAVAPTSAADANLDLDSTALEGLRLLVADDNPINRELVRVMLAPHGVEITDAADGVEAVRQANEAPFDLILMDIRTHLRWPDRSPHYSRGWGAERPHSDSRVQR